MNKLLWIMLWGLFVLFSLCWTVFADTGVTFGNTDAGINFSNNCLTGMWKWCFNYEKMIWIEDQQRVKYSAESIVQDIVLAATSMVWVVLTIVLIYCGLMYIFAARWWKDPGTYKKWLIDAGIWAVLVWWAYTIIRLIQYIAKW